MYEWLLFFHVLSAFVLVAGMLSYGVIVLGDEDVTRRALAAPAAVLWNVGGLAVLVLGVSLAIDVDGYEVWDGWILAAIVLWLVASASGGVLSGAAQDLSTPLNRSRARLLLAVMVLATAALLVDMVFKPGA